ncbi:MAG: cellobiose phosphorylase, partial [Mobilitalea sp.]
ELVPPAQAHKNVATIQKNLKCPDGVRLMDRPASYNGGESRLFKRAEQAANVGREISLQYTHAHIRYIEAMAKIGENNEAWDSLFNVNPILINESVPTANIRQSNMYFSSSDGAYHDRYDYAANFNLLREGKITVKGGWRLYSSGPGIYMRQLISHILGIRFVEGILIIDPVLPDSMDGLTFTFDCFHETKTFCYHLAKNNTTTVECDRKPLPFVPVKNPYRTGGICITREALLSCKGTIDIYF